MNETVLKYIQKVTKWLFMLCIPLFLLTGFIAIALNSQWLYEHSFNTYGVEQTTGIEKAELEKAERRLYNISIHPKSIYRSRLSRTAPISRFSIKKKWLI